MVEDMSDTCQVAVIGIGVMGSAITRRLVETGCDVSVFDVDTARVEQMVELGATAASSPANATSATKFTVLSLNTADIVERVVFGPNGVAETASSDKLLIDMSSINPEDTITFAGRLTGASGMGWTDNPLSGGAPAAATGTLTIMAGGDQQDYDRASEVMDRLSENRTLMGPVGAGQATKLINQILVGNGFATLMECAELAVKGGIEPTRIPKALAGGRADSAILQEFFVKLAVRDYSPTGRIDNMLKDLLGAQDFARGSGVPTPMLSANVELHKWLVAHGHGSADTAAMMEFVERGVSQ